LGMFNQILAIASHFETLHHTQPRWGHIELLVIHAKASEDKRHPSKPA